MFDYCKAGGGVMRRVLTFAFSRCRVRHPSRRRLAPCTAGYDTAFLGEPLPDPVLQHARKRSRSSDARIATV